MVISSSAYRPLTATSPLFAPVARPAHQGVHCRVASNRSDYLGAFRLLYENYRRSGLCDPHPSGIRVLPCHLQRQTQVFVCELDGEICGTVSLVMDEGTPLPADDIFPREVAFQRQRHLKIAETTSLAISPNVSKSKPELFARLTAIAYHYARNHSVDRALATVHPRHARAYRRAMGFDQIGDVRAHAGVRGNPAQLVATNVHEPERISESWRPLYFGDRFTPAQLRRTSMSFADREYFQQFLMQYAAAC